MARTSNSKRFALFLNVFLYLCSRFYEVGCQLSQQNKVKYVKKNLIH